MRRCTLAVVGLLAVGLSAGCTPKEIPAADRPENLLVSVFLDRDATEAQTTAVQARLRQVPDARDLRFLTRQQAYDRFLAMYPDDPELTGPVKVEHMPESFEFTLPDRTAFDRAYRGPLRTDLRRLAGIESVVFRGHQPQPSVAECVADYSGRIPTQALLEVRVFLSGDATAEEKQAVEARLRAVPGATDVKLRGREEAYELFREMYRDVTPEVVASAKPADLPEALLLTLADRAALLRANDDRLAEQVCRLTGVDKVFVPPKSLASRR